MTTFSLPRALRWFVRATLLPALVGCASHHGTALADPELAAATRAAQLAFGQDRMELAAQLYARALMRARAMDDAAGIADAAYNLAACLTEMGQYSHARVQLEEAQVEARRAGRSDVDVLLVTATVMRLQLRPHDAQAMANQVLNHGPPSTDIERAEAHLIMAEAACDANDPLAATNHLHYVNLPASSSLTLQSRLAASHARIRVLQKDWKGAARDFDRAAELARLAQRYSIMARDLANGARAYEVAGLPGLAGDRYYRAARAMDGLGGTGESLKLLSASQAAAKAAGDLSLETRAASLRAEIAGATSVK